MKKALIAGATGAIGSALLARLNQSNQYSEIHCIGRRAPTITGSKIKSHLVSADEIKTFSLDAHIDDVFCTLGTTIKSAGSVENFKKVDRDYVVGIGELAQRLQCQTFSVITAIDANADSSNYYNQTKGETEALLQQLDLAAIRIFRPSMLHGSRDEFRLKESVGFWLLTALTPILQGPWKKYRAIHIEQVAKAMYESASLNYPKFKIFESDEIQKF